MRIRYVMGLIGLAIGCQACSFIKEPNVPKVASILKDESGQDGRACIRERSIRGWGAQHHAIFVDTSDKYYLVTTLLRCGSLDTTANASFKGRFNKICGGRQDKIVTPDDVCIIQNIFEYEDREQAQLSLQAALEKRQSLKESEKSKGNSN